MLEHDGYGIVENILGREQISKLSKEIQPLLQGGMPAGIRNLAYLLPSIGLLAKSNSIRALVEPILGLDAKLIRSVLFNKDQETNWQVAWHQDLSIAVQCQADIEGFTSWSVKEGITHTQAPVAILEKMLTVRLHLDDADENNGALWVSPGTHRLGRLPAGEAANVAERHGRQICQVKAGDALLMRPLILHASRKAVAGQPRRVIHLEFVGVSLPAPLQWCEAA